MATRYNSLLVDATGVPAGGPPAAIPLHVITAKTLEERPDWADIARQHGVTAKPGETLLIQGEGQLSAALICVAESGDIQAALARDPWWLAPLAEALPEGDYALASDIAPAGLVQGAFAWCMAHYRFTRYKAGGDAGPQRRLHLEPTARAEALMRVEAATLVRDLVNTPAEDMDPPALESAAAQLAAAHDGEITVITGERLLHAVFPAVHAVGRAAGEGKAPRLIDIGWHGSQAGEQAPHIALVGKGVCFDSGGLNLKGADSMRWMKKDMGGAAHVLGLASLIMAHDLPIRLRVIIPAVENAVSSGAFRPGDVLQTRAGKTVEVGNTDAEGRLILADALTYAGEASPDLILDFATLTGAARVALGPDLPAVFTDDEELWRALDLGVGETGDPVWRLPLYAPYKSGLDSDIADIANITGDGMAGAVTAALFLQEFAAPARWAHVDVFAWRPQAKPGRSFGGAAQGLFATFAAIRHLFRV